MKLIKYCVLTVLSLAAVAGPVMRGSVKEKTTSRLKFVSEGRDTLVGLRGVFVGVEYLSPEAEKYGLTRKALQTDTELRLRQHGITVLTKEEYLGRPEAAHLYINVLPGIKEERGFAAVSINVRLAQRVFLVRDPNIVCLNATTWERSGIGLYGLNNLNQVRGWVKNYVDEFINDYLAANPKHPAQEKDKNKKD